MNLPYECLYNNLPFLGKVLVIIDGVFVLCFITYALYCGFKTLTE